MTAEQIFEIVPVLKTEIDALLKSAHDENCWADYERAKSLMAKHVGFHATEPRVKTAEAYNVMLAYICEKLNL